MPNPTIHVMRHLITFFLGGFLLFSVIDVHSQSSTDVGLEVQVYPTGIIPGIRIETQLSERSALNFRLGYQWIRHRDLGVHEDERGNGFGFTGGYRHYFQNSDHDGWNIGFKTDVWLNDIDWKDNIGSTNQATGNTNITVIQPTLELGYLILNEHSIFITPTLSFGYEWNVKTKGEPTGEGAILLIGIQIGKRF